MDLSFCVSRRFSAFCFCLFYILFDLIAFEWSVDVIERKCGYFLVSSSPVILLCIACIAQLSAFRIDRKFFMESVDEFCIALSLWRITKM